MIVHDTIRDTIIFLQNTNGDMEILKNIVEVSNSSIGNQISMLNAFIAGFSLIFVIAGFFLGVYIYRLEKRVVKIKDNIEDKEMKITSLAKTVEDTDKKIQSDISGLYAELRNEESITLLKRLEEEPQDVVNLSQFLLSRQLKTEWFIYLKNAFNKLMELGDLANEDNGILPSYKECYLQLMFQHYMYNVIDDSCIREEIRPVIYNCIECAFKRDIIKTTKDLCKALSETSVVFDKCDFLAEYLTALNNSKYNNLSELKIIFEERISDRNLLPDAIEKCTNKKVYLNLFGIIPPVES